MNRMKELREERGITMKEAASALDMPYTTYVNYEKGVREPNSETLIKIADFYNTSIDYLINRSSAHFPKDDRLSIEEFHIVSFHYQYILRTHHVNEDKLSADTNISLENLLGLANDRFCEISKIQIEKLAHALGVTPRELTAPTPDAVEYAASEGDRIHYELEQKKIPFIKTTFDGKNPFSNENISSDHPVYPQICADFMFWYDKDDAKTAGIEKGDLIWAKKATQAKDGDRVVIAYQQQIYIRRIYHKENNIIVLSSDDSPLIIDGNSKTNWQLVGIVTLVGRPYHGDVPPDQL